MTTMPPRGLDRRIARLEVLAPRPAPELEPDDPAALLAWLLDSELIFVDRGACDDAALAELLDRAQARRDQGGSMTELAAQERQCECALIDGGRHRRVVLHPIDPAKWVDLYSGEEGAIPRPSRSYQPPSRWSRCARRPPGSRRS